MYEIPPAKRMATRALAVLDQVEPRTEGEGAYARIALEVYTYALRGFGAYTKLIEGLDPLTQANFGEMGRIMPQMLMATHHCAAGEYDQSITYFEEIIAISRPDGYHLASIQGMLGLVFVEMGQVEKARSCFYLSLTEAERFGLYTTQIGITIELFLLDNPDAAHEEIISALEDFLPDVGSFAAIGHELIFLGGTYVSFGLFGKARRLFRLGLSILQGEVSRSEYMRSLIVVGKFLIAQFAIANRRS